MNKIEVRSNLGNRDQSCSILEHSQKLNFIETRTLGKKEQYKLSQNFYIFVQTTFTSLHYLFLEQQFRET